MKMHSNIRNFQDLEVYKAGLKGEIGKKELEIGHRYRDLREALVPSNINNFLIDSILNRPDILLKAGLAVYSLLNTPGKGKKPRKKR